jgi:hypothetical protein
MRLLAQQLGRHGSLVGLCLICDRSGLAHGPDLGLPSVLELADLRSHLYAMQVEHSGSLGSGRLCHRLS